MVISLASTRSLRARQRRIDWWNFLVCLVNAAGRSVRARANPSRSCGMRSKESSRPRWSSSPSVRTWAARRWPSWLMIMSAMYSTSSILVQANLQTASIHPRSFVGSLSAFQKRSRPSSSAQKLPLAAQSFPSTLIIPSANR